MIIMINHITTAAARRLYAKYPQHVGNLFTPGKWHTPLGEYALDNGRFAKGERWSAGELFGLYARAARYKTPPRWLLVPDIVGDWRATLAEWAKWASVLEELGWPLAMAVQDGATPEDVRWLTRPPDVIFVGGSTRFKWSTFARWCAEFPRVHVGRVNSPRETWRCWQAGAESIDGTGWFRTTRQRKGLAVALEALATKERPTPHTLFGCAETAA